MANFTLGVMESARSSLVTQSISSVHNRFEMWTLDIFYLCLRLINSSASAPVITAARSAFSKKTQIQRPILHSGFREIVDGHYVLSDGTRISSVSDD